MEGFKAVPGNAKFELQLPLARKNITNGIHFLNTAMAAMGPENLYSIEIGNEPDLYPAPWTFQSYMKALSEYQKAVVSAVPSLKKPIFRGLDYSSGDNLNGEFSVANAFNAGYDSHNGVKEISLHYYQTRGGDSLSDDLLSPSATEKSTKRFISSIQYLKKHHPSIPLILGEVGDSIGTIGNNKEPHKWLSLGAGVWTANWMLYCMTIGIDRVETQLVARSQFSPWHPFGDAAQQSTAGVTGPFYGLLMISDLIASADKGLTVTQLATGNERMTAYAGYNGGVLSRVILFNTELWVPGGKKSRPSQEFVLVLPKGTTKATVQRLAGSNGAELEKLSWAGQRWSYPSGEPTNVGPTEEDLKVVNGQVTVSVPATEGATVAFH